MPAGNAGDLYGNEQDAAQDLDILGAVNVGYLLKNGQGFTANGRGATVTNANLLNCALSLFNPSGSGKTLVVYSLRVLATSTGGSLSQLNLTTTDPGNSTGITTQLTPTHLPGVTTPTSATTAWQTATANTTTVVAPGTKIEEFIPTNGVTTEVLANGSVIVLPAGNGLATMILVGTAGGYYQACAKWVEV